MSNNELLINKEEFKNVVNKNNENLIKNGTEIISVEKNDGVIHYIKKDWKFLKSTNRTTGVTSYALELLLNCNHGKGRPITIRIRLTQSQADYIINKCPIDLYNGSMLLLKTRFMYGFQKDGSPYASCIILFGKQVISIILDSCQEEIFFDKMSKFETAYDIYLDEKLTIDITDSINIDDVIDE